ncbi:MAG: AI-2E family transporter [Pseudorhodobacter sp.]
MGGPFVQPCLVAPFLHQVIGQLIATVQIVAMAFSQGTQTGLIVLIGYVVIQTIEGNVVGPLIQQHAVNLAPALLIAVQVLLSLVFRGAGLILAALLTAVAMVAVRKFWLEHAPGKTKAWQARRYEVPHAAGRTSQ